MGEILDGITKAGGGSFVLDYDRGTPATINDPELTQWMVPSVRAIMGDEGVVELNPTMGGEDFSYFVEALKRELKIEAKTSTVSGASAIKCCYAVFEC